jgi:hypothetical protein
LIGHDLPRIHVIGGEYIKKSRGDAREAHLGYIPGPTKDTRPDLRQVVLDQQKPKPKPPPRKPIQIRWGWVVAAVFVTIVALQCIQNYRPAFKPYGVPVSTIRYPECGLDGTITGAVLESPSPGNSPSIYQLTCASGETLADWQRP